MEAMPLSVAGAAWTKRARERGKIHLMNQLEHKRPVDADILKAYSVINPGREAMAVMNLPKWEARIFGGS